MVRGFIPSFAKRLEDHTKNKVLMAKDMSYLDSVNIYLCNGFTEITEENFILQFKNKDSASTHEYNPDINTILTHLLL